MLIQIALSGDMAAVTTRSPTVAAQGFIVAVQSDAIAAVNLLAAFADLIALAAPGTSTAGTGIEILR